MKLVVNDTYIGLIYDGRKRSLSSAVFNGGYKQANLFFNIHVNQGDLKNKDPEILIEEFLKKNGFDNSTAVALLTAANLKYAQVAFRKHGETIVLGVISAGTSNAMNPVIDGNVEYSIINSINPGTINIILATNSYLYEECLVSTIITATEAKTAALIKLKVKSVYSPAQATGTGTDSVLIISGNKKSVRYSGGHTPFGKMVAEVVYEAVIKSLEKKPIDTQLPENLLKELE